MNGFMMIYDGIIDIDGFHIECSDSIIEVKTISTWTYHYLNIWFK